jgi:hypothetical protein
MMVAKGIGGGFPLGAVLATEAAAAGMTAGTHGSTYGGNPLGCAVGCRVMEIVADDAFLAEVNAQAGLLRQKLEGLVAAHPDVFEGVRGAGLMLGLKCRVPNTDVVAAGYASGSSRCPRPTTSSASCRRSRSPTTRSPKAWPASTARPPASPATRPERCPFICPENILGGSARGQTPPRSPRPRKPDDPLPRHPQDRPRRPARHDRQARAMKTARDGRPRARPTTPAARRPDGRADLREALDPHPHLLRRGRAPDGRRDDGALGRRHAARPWRDHRRHRPGAVALRRPDHDPHLRGGDAARDGRARRPCRSSTGSRTAPIPARSWPTS